MNQELHHASEISSVCYQQRELTWCFEELNSQSVGDCVFAGSWRWWQESGSWRNGPNASSRGCWAVTWSKRQSWAARSVSLTPNVLKTGKLLVTNDNFIGNTTEAPDPYQDDFMHCFAATFIGWQLYENADEQVPLIKCSVNAVCEVVKQ